MKTILALIVLLSLATVARADTIYTYTGGSIGVGHDPGQTTDRALIGDFVLAGDPVVTAGYWDEVYVTPIAYYFTDGIETLTQPNSTGSFLIAGYSSCLAARCTLGLDSWRVGANDGSGNWFLSALYGSAVEATDQSPNLYVEGGFGQWTASSTDPVNTPEPGAILLTLMGILVVMALAAVTRCSNSSMNASPR